MEMTIEDNSKQVQEGARLLLDLFFSGDAGIRTLVPGISRQMHFEFSLLFGILRIVKESCSFFWNAISPENALILRKKVAAARAAAGNNSNSGFSRKTRVKPAIWREKGEKNGHWREK